MNFVAEYETKIKLSFFEQENRKGTTEDKEITKDISPIFEEIYITNQAYCYSSLQKENQHPILKSFLGKTKSDIGNSSPKKTCDSIFYEFLKLCQAKANKSYFLFILKTFVIFRESINKLHNYDYTHSNNAENIPEFTNNFFIFMEECEYFGLNDDHSKIEFIELIHYFCHWLYTHSYTATKLNLLTK